MRRPNSVKALEDLGRVRLSPDFFLRDFLYSEIASHYRIPNVPDDPDLAIEVGTRLCVDLLEPLHARFGRLAIRSAFRSLHSHIQLEKRQIIRSTQFNDARHMPLQTKGNRVYRLRRRCRTLRSR